MAAKLSRSTRFRNSLAICGLCSAALVVALHLLSRSLWDARFWSGWLLLTSVIFLALYGLRKRLVVLPLGSTARWMRLHGYVGVVTVLLFGLHAMFLPTMHWQLPQGRLEQLLAGLFVAVALAGVVGLGLSRWIPARITHRGEEVLFERIAAFRRDLMARSQALVLGPRPATEQGGLLADYYANRLFDFFARPHNLGSHIAQSRASTQGVRRELQELHRYLSVTERQAASELGDLIEKKDELDYQYAHQLLLKGWLFVHGGLVGSLLIVASLHAILAMRFGGQG